MKKIILGVLSGLCIGCEDRAADYMNTPGNAQPRPDGVVDYGEKVYYFPFLEDKFANALATFIHQHEGWEVASMVGNGTCHYGSDCGYFVVFRMAMH